MLSCLLYFKAPVALLSENAAEYQQCVHCWLTLGRRVGNHQLWRRNVCDTPAKKKTAETERTATDGGSIGDYPPLLLRPHLCCLEGFSDRFSRIQRGEIHSGSAHTPSLSARAALPGRHLQNRPPPLTSHSLF